MGSRPKPYLGQGVVLILQGAIDSRQAGNALFPECLKDDLHGIRASLEAYSASARLGGRAEASACGYHVRNSAVACQLEVLTRGAWEDYRIDRWD